MPVVTISETVTAAVVDAVAEAVGVDTDEVTDDATLLGDLGAESIDLLDILFRLERALSVKISAGELAGYVQGGIPDDEFGDEHEIITAKGLAQLEQVMPQIDVEQLAGTLQADEVMGLFTVANLATLVQQRMNGAVDTADTVGAVDTADTVGAVDTADTVGTVGTADAA